MFHKCSLVSHVSKGVVIVGMIVCLMMYQNLFDMDFGENSSEQLVSSSSVMTIVLRCITEAIYVAYW
jgi:hypothetical protein